jgi:hypothetical protein
MLRGKKLFSKSKEGEDEEMNIRRFWFVTSARFARFASASDRCSHLKTLTSIKILFLKRKRLYRTHYFII